MIAIFTNDHLGQYPRCSNAALLQAFRQWSDHGSQLGFISAHELAANDLTSEKLRRLEIEHLGEFFSDTAKCLRIVSDFRGLNDFLFDRYVLPPALSALLLVRSSGDWL